MALISLLTSKPARRDVAMTGELTLSGRILPVAGIREKLHAAQRAGIRKVILPRSNETHLKSLEADVTEGLEVMLAEDIVQITELVLE
jgi:ATP-dependent Lon protease